LTYEELAIDGLLLEVADMEAIGTAGFVVPGLEWGQLED